MKNKHSAILEKIFRNPVQASIVWRDIEAMLIGLGAEVSEGNGSRVRIILNRKKMVFHRPHPHKETDKGAIMTVRQFLINAGVRKC
jgi:hypothetical protein